MTEKVYCFSRALECWTWFPMDNDVGCPVWEECDECSGTGETRSETVYETRPDATYNRGGRTYTIKGRENALFRNGGYPCPECHGGLKLTEITLEYLDNELRYVLNGPNPGG